MKVNTQALKLCLVTHRQDAPFENYLNLIAKAIQGGVTSVQLREKSVDDATLLTMAQALQRMLIPLGIPLIINDHLHIAHAVNAAGVHLGAHDASPEEARARLGEKAWIGLSIDTLDALALANQNPHLHYVAASAVFKTKTKTDCVTYWGLDGLSVFCQQSRYPVVAIGGIHTDNVAEVKACGVAGVAVVGAIHDAVSPEAEAQAFRHILE